MSYDQSDTMVGIKSSTTSITSTGITSTRGNDVTTSLPWTVSKAAVSVILFPFRIVAPLITNFILINKLMVNHFILIPLKLLFLITIYIPFIKIPIVTPIKFILELNDEFANHDLPWFQSQIELLVINVVHFLMVNVFLGVFVGVIAGLNMKVIRYLLTWDKKSNKKLLNNEPVIKKNIHNMSNLSRTSVPISNINNIDDLQKSPLSEKQQFSSHSSPNARAPASPSATRYPPFSFLESVVVPSSPNLSPSSTVESLGISELPSSNKTKSFSTAINRHGTHNIRNKTAKQAKPSEPDMYMYEDDDGYNYTYEDIAIIEEVSEPSPPASSLESPTRSSPTKSRPRSPNTSLNQLSNIAEEEEPTSKEESVDAHDLFSENAINSDTLKTSVSTTKE